MTQPTAFAASLLPAEGDLVVAWPQAPQQLFLLLHGAGQQPADWQPLAQRLAQQFPLGLVAALAVPLELRQDAGTGVAVTALRGLVRRWQTHTGLDFSRTALLAQGTVASVALQWVMQHADGCARLFAVGGRLPESAQAISEQTSLHWLHGQDDDGMPDERLREAAQQLQALDVDFTFDVLTGSCATCTPEIQQRVLHLLQNHVPKRLWREALASAGAVDATVELGSQGPETLH